MSSSAPPTARRMASTAPRSRWEFEERHPWEQGFAGYYRDWIIPELERWEATRRAGEQGFRRWLPLLLAAWLALTLLIAETSGSLPITLIWAVVLLIVGGALARGLETRARASALRSVRDRVMGFFGLRPLASLRTLESLLRTHGLPKGEAAPALGEQFWGVHQGIGLRLARLTPPTGAPRRPGLVLLIEADGADARPLPAHRPDGPTAQPEHATGGMEQGLASLSQALGGATLDYARDRKRILVIAHPRFDPLDWPLPQENPEPQLEADEIEAVMRALLRCLHQILEAALLLARPDCEKI